MGLLSRCLHGGNILLDVSVPDKAALFRQIGCHLQGSQGLSVGPVQDALSRRERIGSTAVGEGVAIPHARMNTLSEMLALYLRLATPIGFEAPDDRPVSDVLVLLVPAPAVPQHLHILAEAAELFSSGSFRASLDMCESPDQVKALFDQWGPAG